MKIDFSIFRLFNFSRRVRCRRIAASALGLAVIAGAFFARAGESLEACDPCFEWVSGEAPSGWITNWTGKADGGVATVIGPSGTNESIHVTSKTWSPYSSDAAALPEYTFCTYGSADGVTASNEHFAVLWCMGRTLAKNNEVGGGEKTALVKDSSGRICLVQLHDTDAAPARLITGPVVSGYHVFTVRFSTVNGASLQIDEGEVYSDASFTQIAGSGIQIGDVRAGAVAPFMIGEGFAILKMIAFNTDAIPDWQYKFLCNDPLSVEAVSEDDITHECVLRVSEIMPKPTDSRSPGLCEGMDVNGLESGWVEVENTSDKWADLGDYLFIRTNRGKKTNTDEPGNLPSRLIPPYSRAVFYTSERYPNSDTPEESAFAEGTWDVKPRIYGNLNNVIVYGKKVNPKKSPFVRLYYAPGGNIESIVDTIIVPSDLPEGWSIIVGEHKDGAATERWMCPSPTRGKANTSTDGLARIGPNVGPVYENVDGKKIGTKHEDTPDEFARTRAPAIPGTDYDIEFSLNPVMSPTVAGGFRDEDKIASIRLVYRMDLDPSTLATNNVDMTTKVSSPKTWGDTYTATIPSSAFPARGHLIQWKFLVTDVSGNEWTSPSFNNPDDGYEWYGTIVEPTSDLMSATLPTWHMFADKVNMSQMDYDTTSTKGGGPQDKSIVPYYARIAIYDSSTSNYYDYVRIDLRGNTSASFTKKGHGLRFAKAHPLNMTDIVTGEQIKDIRKTSLISEFADPSKMRQMVAFWLWRKMGNLVPFDFPVRCNLNGAFYQLAFNSERFTDELIEDVYKLDKYGYSYKNVGTLKSGTGTTAGGIEKKTPDDENESDISVLQSRLRKPLYDCGAQKAGEDIAALTRLVVERFDLPAWLNYLASARITQEMDDVWANLCIYLDDPLMHPAGGVRGTGTWMPLGYDMNITFGQYYHDKNVDTKDLMADEDWFKSHPFYGGNRVACYSSSSMSGVINTGNDGFEAIFQSAKFRRLYLRRLRTLMDEELKSPGTPESEVPFMVEMRKLAALMRADAAIDDTKWPNNNSDDAIDAWRSTTRPANIDAGIDEIWDRYVVPRRTHLYVTHSITNSAKAAGYGSEYSACIPLSQSPIASLAPNITISNLTTLDEEQSAALGVDQLFYNEDVVVIHNANSEAVDMSGWRLDLSVQFTFPAGTVCDANDDIYIVRDRRAYIAGHLENLTDQVIIGNAKFAITGAIALYDGAGTLVFVKAPETDEHKYLRLHSFCGNTAASGGDEGEWFTLTNISATAALDLNGASICFLKDDNKSTEADNHCHIAITSTMSIPPLGSLCFNQTDWTGRGWVKIQNNKQRITIWDKYNSVCQSLKVTQKNFPLAYGLGGWLVCDSTEHSVADGTTNWHQEYAMSTDSTQGARFEASDLAAASNILANAGVTLTKSDVEAGLEAKYLAIVPEPVAGEDGKYEAVVIVNPATVPQPAITAPSMEADEGKTTFCAAISNAIIGLWYGCEVADSLDGEGGFANDTGSFQLATNASHNVTASPREKPSGFFRIKVLPAMP